MTLISDITPAFYIATTTGSKYAWYAATLLVVPGQWYELTLIRQITAFSVGFAEVIIDWQDIDGNAVRSDTLEKMEENDVAPVALELYAKAPVHAARAQVRMGAGIGANLTAYFSAVAFRRCPLRLIVVAEDAAGALTSYAHPIALTCKYNAHYEVAR